MARVGFSGCSDVPDTDSGDAYQEMFCVVLLEISGCFLQNWLKQNCDPELCPKISPRLVSVIEYFARTVA